MKILLLGSTGRTGKHILQIALQRGHVIHALVRSKQKVSISHPNLHIYEGDPLDKKVLGNAMAGCEAIINALNISRTSDWPWARLRTPENFLCTITSHIIEIAPMHNIYRYVFISAWGVAETRKDIPGWFRWFIDHSNIRFPYLDHARSEELLKPSPLHFTSLRPAGLTNSLKQRDIIVSFNNSPRPNLMISRLNLACFALDTLEKNLYVRGFPVLSQK